jgi:hypothetical protein
MRQEMAGRLLEQLRADPEPLELVTDVEIVQQGSPGGISVANGVGEAEQIVTTLGDDREIARHS